MPAAIPPICDFGWNAPGFDLADPSGNRYTLLDVAGPKGVLVMFICNHCPYVKSIADRISAAAKDLQGRGVGVAAIMANDYASYPDDAPEKMKTFAEAHDFTFPYLIDEDQSVARAYAAVCTPDFFGFNDRLELQYRGRFGASGSNAVPDARPELLEAMRQVASTGQGPRDQTASIGCSIKWRNQREA